MSAKNQPSAKKYMRALHRLARLEKFGSRPGLGRIKKLLSRLGNPHEKYKCVLVAGTNGKGSTTFFMQSILSSARFRTGSYFSPHIFSFRERMQINGKKISEKDFASCAQEVFAAAKKIPGEDFTFFEILTAMAFLYFARKKVCHAVLEVGLGGRLDATNACSPVASIITSIGYDHMKQLGGTLPKITREKSGIMRKGKPAIFYIEDNDARKAALSYAKKIGAKPIDVNKSLEANKIILSSGRQLIIPTGAHAIFQRTNMACAAICADSLGVENGKIPSGLSASPPARYERIFSKPEIIIDCAHNPPAAKALLPQLARDFSPNPQSRRILVFAAMKDKEYSKVLKLLSPYFDSIIACSPAHARAEGAKILLRAARHAGFSSAAASASPSPAKAYRQAKRLAGRRGRILIAGSIYLLQSLFCSERIFLSG